MDSVLGSSQSLHQGQQEGTTHVVVVIMIAGVLRGIDR